MKNNNIHDIVNDGYGGIDEMLNYSPDHTIWELSAILDDGTFDFPAPLPIELLQMRLSKWAKKHVELSNPLLSNYRYYYDMIGSLEFVGHQGTDEYTESDVFKLMALLQKTCDTNIIQVYLEELNHVIEIMGKPQSEKKGLKINGEELDPWEQDPDSWKN